MASEEARTHTAIHVMKGALQNVLAVGMTSSTHVSGRNGRITVQSEKKPTAEELARVEEAANRKVADGAEVLEFEMERQEAEMHFGSQIYDLFPVPSGVTKLRIVRIPEWNINCCAEHHVESTSLVGPLKLGRARYRNSRKELELEFELADLTTWNR